MCLSSYVVLRYPYGFYYILRTHFSYVEFGWAFNALQDGCLVFFVALPGPAFVDEGRRTMDCSCLVLPISRLAPVVRPGSKGDG